MNALVGNRWHLIPKWVPGARRPVAERLGQRATDLRLMGVAAEHRIGSWKAAPAGCRGRRRGDRPGRRDHAYVVSRKPGALQILPVWEVREDSKRGTHLGSGPAMMKLPAQ